MGVIQQKFERDLALRGMRPNTIKTYVHCCRRFVKHMGRSPLELSIADVTAYLEHLRTVERKSARSLNVYAAALAYLFRNTLGRPLEVGAIPRARVRAKLPDVLSASEVERIIDALGSPRQRAVVFLMYGAGLRVSEACALRIDDIDSRRMQIRVRDGKGGRERYVPLGRRVLSELRTYFRWRRPCGPLLFPGSAAGGQLGRAALNQALRRAARKAGIDKRVTPHSMRHSAATHLLELGTDLRKVQVLLGHATLRSTSAYLHVSRDMLAKVTLPVDLLGTDKAHLLG